MPPTPLYESGNPFTPAAPTNSLRAFLLHMAKDPILTPRRKRFSPPNMRGVILPTYITSSMFRPTYINRIQLDILGLQQLTQRQSHRLLSILNEMSPPG